MRGHYGATGQRRRLHGDTLPRGHVDCVVTALLSGNVDGFGTIKKPTQADDTAHVSYALPLTAKFELHDKHNQHDKDMQRIPVELEREEKLTSHRSTFPAPSVYPLGAYCVERSRTRRSNPALLSAINVIRQIEALPVYMGVA